MPSPRSLLASLDPEARDAFVSGLSDAEAAALFYDWQAWARPEQLMPGGAWDGWLVLAGRGYGKTRMGAEAVCAEAASGRSARIGLVAETSAERCSSRSSIHFTGRPASLATMPISTT